MSVQVNFTGFDNLQSSLTKECNEIEDVTKSQMYAMAVKILKEAMLEVPKDTHALVNSGFIVEDDDSIILGFGGPDAKINPKSKLSAEEYALKVHEDLSLNHINGKAKFLEDPYREVISDLQNNLIRPLQSLFK